MLSYEMRSSGCGRGLLSKFVRLLLASSLFMFFVGCKTTPTPPPDSIWCPMPNTTEIDDYALIVEAGPDRPAVRWISRMIAYCFPNKAEEVRDSER